MQSITKAVRSDCRLNVLEVIGNAGMGGMENYIKSFISNLPSDQFRVTCVCPCESSFTDSLRKLGVEEVFITPIEDDPAWRSIQLTAEVARLHQIDVLHAHMPKAHVLAGLASCLIHKPVAATVHGMNVTSHELGITRAVGSHLITNCQEAFTQALAMGVPAERVNLVRNGVDIEAFIPGDSGEEFRNFIGVPLNTPLVGYVGRLEHEKGPDLFLRAAEYVKHLRPDVHFVMVGAGNMRDHLREMCINMHLESQVHFTGWYANTAKIYTALDLLAHTSRSDGTSLVLLEAMASACPVVGLAVGGGREIIENESTGLMAGAGDWEGLGMKIIQLLEEPERLKTMGTLARARVVHYFNVATNTRGTAAVLRSLATEANVQRLGSNGSNSTVSREVDGRVSFDRSRG